MSPNPPCTLGALLAIALATATLAVGCAGAPSDPATVSANRTFNRDCGGCHPLPEPDHLTPDAWRPVLARHRGRVFVTDAEWADLRYLLTSPRPAEP